MSTQADPNESVTQEANRIINGDRRSSYGPTIDSFHDIAVGWSILVDHPISSKQVAQCMIWLKQIREKNKSNRDNWVDIAGYADLGHQVTLEIPPNL